MNICRTFSSLKRGVYPVEPLFRYPPLGISRIIAGLPLIPIPDVVLRGDIRVRIVSPFRPFVVRRGEVVVHHVQNDRDAALMARAHEMLQLIRAARAGLQAEEQRRSVAPLQIAIEFQHRQQLHRIHAQGPSNCPQTPWRRRMFRPTWKEIRANPRAARR